MSYMMQGVLLGPPPRLTSGVSEFLRLAQAPLVLAGQSVFMLPVAAGLSVLGLPAPKHPSVDRRYSVHLRPH
jgi:hypothetical protein